MTVDEMNNLIQRLDVPDSVGTQLRESIIDRDQVNVENINNKDAQGLVGMYSHVSDGDFPRGGAHLAASTQEARLLDELLEGAAKEGVDRRDL